MNKQIELKPFQQPTYINGIKIFVSEPQVNKINFENVIDALVDKKISSKTQFNSKFQQNLKSYFEVPTACSVSNGYTGLLVIIKALKILGQTIKNQIILPTATMVAVANAVIDNQLTPVLVDNYKGKLNPSFDMIISKVTPNTKAIIVTHTYGVPFERLDELFDFCQKNQIFLIQDIAEAIGTQFKGNYVGKYGHFASASLYANKLITCGDGGFILSRFKQLRTKNLQSFFKSLINHGFTNTFHFHHTQQTGNYRINGLGAAFICDFNLYIEQTIENRKYIDKLYRQYLSGSSHYDLMEKNYSDESVPWVFAMTTKNSNTRKNLRQHLADKSIQTRPYFKPIHSQNFMKKYLKEDETFPISEQQYLTGLYLPTFKNITKDEIKYVSDSVNQYYQNSDHLEIAKIDNQKEITKKPNIELFDLLSQKHLNLIIQSLNNLIQKEKTDVSLSSKILKNLKILGKSIVHSSLVQLSDIKNPNQQIKNNEQSGQQEKQDMQNYIQNTISFQKNIEKPEQILIGRILKQKIGNIKSNSFFSYNQVQNQIFEVQPNQKTQKNLINLYQQKTQEQKLNVILHNVSQKLTQFHFLFDQNFTQKESKLIQNDQNKLKEQIFKLRQNEALSTNFSQLLKILQIFIKKLDQKSEKINKYRIHGLIHNNLQLQHILINDNKQVRFTQLGDCRISEVSDQFVNLKGFWTVQQINTFIQFYFQKLCQKLNTKIQTQNLNLSGFIERIQYRKHIGYLNEIICLAKQQQTVSVQFRQSIRKSVDKTFNYLKKSNLIGQGEQIIYSDLIFKIYTFIDPKLEIQKKLQMNVPLCWDHHFGGWKFVQQLVGKYFCCKNGNTEFISSIQKYYYDSHDSTTFQNTKYWTGFIHNVPLQEYNNCENLQILLENFNFHKKLKSCKGLLCMTTQIKNYLVKKLNVHVQLLYYPFTPPKQVFNVNCLKQKQIRLLHVGQYLRNFDWFQSLPKIMNLNKTLLKPSDLELKLKDNSDITIVDYLEGQQYEKTLSNSVLIMNLHGAGGCTTVIQAISRNIPLVVNRLKPLEQYLGLQYPLFYNNIADACQLLNNLPQNAQKAHQYLMRMDKSKFYPQTFVRNLSQSFTYEMIPVPNDQKKQFESYDLTIFMISYKRFYNLETILNSLANQTYKGTVEIIIWNNNPEISIKWLQHKYQSKFANFVIIQSSFNYYCIVRSAISNLARGELLMFLDDDVLPKQEFIKVYVQEYIRLSQFYGQKLVTTLKGNVFHALHDQTDIQFWTNFDNIKLLPPSFQQTEIHVIHMDTCLMKTTIMKKCAAQPLPQLQYILVDDYWFSYVLNHLMGCTLIKFRPMNQICIDYTDSENQKICLYKQSKVIKQKNRFYCYHSGLGWPEIYKKDNIIQIAEQHNNMNVKITSKKFVQCQRVYQEGFCGWNIFSSVWKNYLTDIKSQYLCKVVRIGVVDIQNEFLNFFQPDGITLNAQKIIQKKLKSMCDMLKQKGIYFILTMGNLPAKNLLHQRYVKSYPEKQSNWYDFEPLEQLKVLWKIIAKCLKDQPNCIGYDLINQPQFDEEFLNSKLILYNIYETLIQCVRSIDKETPIIIEPLNGNPYQMLSFIDKLPVELLNDEKIILSFHFYQPYTWTSARNLPIQFRYPGIIPKQMSRNKAWAKDISDWNEDSIRDIFTIIIKKANEKNISRHRLLLGEFGCRNDRIGIEEYFNHIFKISNDLKLNHIIYAFRQPWWKKMDYEGHQSIINIIQNNFEKNAKLTWQDIAATKLRKINQLQTPWLMYNPFAFEITNNKMKCSQMRAIIDFSQQSKISTSQIDPTFIVGCGRSGTTLFLKILSFCTDFVCLHQPHIIWLNSFPEFNIWGNDKQVQSQLHNPIAQNVDKKIEKIKRIYSIILKQIKGMTIVDKQPQNILKLEFLMKQFPRSKFIVIKRNQQDVALSISKFQPAEWYGENMFKYKILDQCAKQLKLDFDNTSEIDMLERGKRQWKICQTYYQKCLKNMSHRQRSMIHEVQYEDIVGKKLEQSLEAVCNFLKLNPKKMSQIIKGAKAIVKSRY